MFASMLRRFLPVRASSTHRNPRKPKGCRLAIEVLEDRTVPANLLVTTASDLAGHAGLSLRDAVALANTDAAVGIPSTIAFDTAAMGTSAISLTQGVLVLSAGAAPITIDGGDGLTINAAGASGVFHIQTGAEAFFRSLTVTAGFANLGGGIWNQGRLTLTQSTIAGNTASLGGGIYNDGVATIHDSTIAGNTASSDGAGARLGVGAGIYNAGTMTIVASTLSSNTAGSNLNIHAGNGGGGVFNRGQLSIVQSTLARNSASGYGGGIDNAGELALANVTISENSVFGINLEVTPQRPLFGGGGVYNANALRIHNSIVAGNFLQAGAGDPTGGGTLVPSIAPDIDGFAMGSNNLVGDGAGLSGMSHGVNGNRVGTAATPLLPGLAPFGNYGGTTQTMPLLNGSQAIQAGGALASLVIAAGEADTVLVTGPNAFSAGAAPAGFVIQIGAEQMLVTHVLANHNLVVVRGHNGTTPAVHVANAPVVLAYDQRGIRRGTQDLGAATFFSPPAVVTAPADQTVANGTRVTFTATAFGNPLPAIQWQVSTNGGLSFVNIYRANAATLSFIARPAHQGFQYRAVFTNVYGQAATEAAELSVLTAPVILSHPAARRVVAGNEVSFTALSNARPVATVQWQISADNGVTYQDVPGADAETFTFIAQSANNANLVRAVFTNALGRAFTRPARLWVEFAPILTLDLADQSALGGQRVNLRIGAVGNPGMWVQWQVSTNNGVSFTTLPGATLGTLSFVVQGVHHGYQYRAMIGNRHGVITTSATTLSVRFAPVISAQPAPQWLFTSREVSFTADARGNPAPTVQWQVSGNNGVLFTNIDGATSTTLTFVSTTADHGRLYRAIFTNEYGVRVTSAASLRYVTLGDPVYASSIRSVKATRHTPDGWVDVPVVAGGAAILPTTLSADPGIYMHNGVAFDCSTPGFYLFTSIDRNGVVSAQRRLFYPRFGVAGFNLDELLGLIGLWTVVGDLDTPLGIDAIMNLAKTRYPVIQCEHTSLFMQAILAQRGLTQTRIARVLTDQPLTGFDDGHVMLEIWNGAGWILVDPLLKRRWDVSMKDFFEAVQAGNMPEDIVYAPLEISWVNNTQMLAYAQSVLGSPEKIREWTAKIFAIPFLQHASGIRYGYNPPGKSYQGVLPSTYQIVSKATWEAMFY